MKLLHRFSPLAAISAAVVSVEGIVLQKNEKKGEVQANIAPGEDPLIDVPDPNKVIKDLVV